MAKFTCPRCKKKRDYSPPCRVCGWSDKATSPYDKLAREGGKRR